MKLFRSTLSMLAIAALFFASACGDDDGNDDDGPQVDPLVGYYAVNNVTLEEEVTFMGTTFPEGADITAIVQGALYAESPCANGANTLIDMRADFNVAYACKDETTAPVTFGTWVISNDRETLTLNLVIAGQNFPLIITDLVENTSNIQGIIQNYPLVDTSVTPPTITPVTVSIRFDTVDL